MDAEIWGRCPTCERWFYCEGWFDRGVPEPSCPVCGAEPTMIENRGAEHATSEGFSRKSA